MARREDDVVNKLTLTDGSGGNKIVITPQDVATTTGTHDRNLPIEINGTTYYILLTTAVS